MIGELRNFQQKWVQFYYDMLAEGSSVEGAEVDQEGNVNVSKFGGRIIGPGGFINISQNSKKVCFLASFTSGKSDIRVGGGSLKILQDGSGVKFRKRVEQITFSAGYALKTGQEVLYITERAVFKLTEKGLTL